MRVLRTLILLLAVLPNLSGETKVIIGGNNSPPFRIFENSSATGLYIDILKLAGKSLGWTLEFREIPMARALVQMEEGSIDLMLGPNRTPERERYMIYLTQVPFPREKKVLLVLPGGRMPEKLEDLEGMTLGVLRGAVYSPAFDQNEKIRKYSLGDYLQGLQMTAAGRLEGVIIPERQADVLATLHPLPLVRAPFTLEGSESYITISRKSALAARTAELIQAMEKVKLTGEYRDILKKYAY